MTLMPDIVNIISRAQVLSKLDLKEAFKQISVLPAHQKYTVFKCHKGVFEYKAISFGLQNTHAVFQMMIEQVLGDMVGVCCLAYMDDILAFSGYCDYHANDTEKVLTAL